MNQNTHLLFDMTQIWVLLIGAIVPVGGYVLNKVLKVTNETVAAAVHVALAAVVAALYTALNTSVFGWNGPTLQLVLSGVVSALMAHGFLWKPAHVNIKLGSRAAAPTIQAGPAAPTR